VNSPPAKPEVILTNFFAEPTVLLVQITSRVPFNYDISPLEKDKFSNVTVVFCVFLVIGETDPPSATSTSELRYLSTPQLNHYSSSLKI
jgi:hypothetical protein